MLSASLQSVPAAAPLPLFDYTMLAIVAVFAILGLVKGMAWQLSRLLILVAGYATAIAFAGRLAPIFDRWIPLDVDPELSTHAARFTLFLVTIVALGVLAWFVHRPKAPLLLTPKSRLLGGVFGIAAGALVALAILTAIGMFLPGRKVALAAERSTSVRVSRQAMDAVATVLPDNLRNSLEYWQLLLGNTTEDGVAPPADDPTEPFDPDHDPGGEPVDGTFRPSDGTEQTPSPHKRIDPKRR
ncbi:MAG: CvpA family protein [Planctomycetota bacterium]